MRKYISPGSRGKLSGPVARRLADLLIAIGEYEKTLEVKRQYLAINENFEPYSAFCRIDRKSTGFITPRDILNFIRDNGLQKGLTEADCYYLVKFFDSDVDGQLHYADFLQILLPCESPKLRTLVTQRPN